MKESIKLVINWRGDVAACRTRDNKNIPTHRKRAQKSWLSEGKPVDETLICKSATLHALVYPCTGYKISLLLSDKRKM